MSEHESDGTSVPNNALPSVAQVTYPAEDDDRRFLVELELSFCTAELLVQGGIVIDAPQMLKWTQEYKDGKARETPLKDVLEWYKRPGKVDDEGVERDAEFVDARVIAIL